MSSDDLSRRPRQNDADRAETSEAIAGQAAARQAEPLPEPAPESESQPDIQPEIQPETQPAPHHRVALAWAGLKGRWTKLPAPVRWAGGILSVLLVIILIFLMIFDWDWFRPSLARIMSDKLHRPVRIDGHLRVHLLSWTPTATVTGLKVGQPGWQAADKAAPTGNMAEIDGITVKAELLPLFVFHVVLPRLEVDHPVVSLYQDKAGRANWDFSDGTDTGKPAKLPPIKNFIIKDGHLAMTSVQRRLRMTATVNANENADAKGGQPFALIGAGTLNGAKFDLKATGGALLNVRTSQPYPFDMHVQAGDTVITAKGRVLHPFNLGQLDGAVTIKGRDLADLYYLTGLTLPNTPAYSIAADIARDDRTYHVTRINGRVGHSDLEGKLTVDIEKSGRPNLTGDLTSTRLDFKDLGSMFGATAANAPSRPKLTNSPEATTGRRLLPDASLDAERIRGMDARVRYRAQSVIASPNMPLRAVSLGVKLDHGLLTLDPIDISFPQGRLIGTAAINARSAVQTNAVDMRVTGLHVENFITQAGKPLEGVIDARLKAAGAGDSVHKAAGSADGRMVVVMPAGMIRQSFAELMGIDATKGLFMLLSKDPHQTPVRCAIADFNIHNGVMQAQNITFDTGVVLVNGSGQVNLNDESMKFVFKGKPKKFRLVRINAPIIIGGHLSAPTFGINAGPAVVQGGLGAILSTVSAPLLALPFINGGGQKDADCGALMGEAQAKGAPTALHAAPARPVPAPVRK
ncbi:AsmA family protein [Asticcacaulis solisilvae]|uniref:AsmA family protein n=1 Tax=Asticcacaulis solisilvae TaxID=1217274 RepID=UPI003FD7F5BC